MIVKEKRIKNAKKYMLIEEGLKKIPSEFALSYFYTN